MHIEEAVALNETTEIDVYGSDLTWYIKWHHVGKVVLSIICFATIAENEIEPITCAVLSVVFKATEGV